MTRFKALAVIAVATFAATAAFAGEQGAACCAKDASGKMAKAGCDMTFADLNLTPEQRTKMEQLATECHGGGCTEATMAKMNQEAEKVLSKEQFATWKASHSTKHSEKTQS